MPKPTTEVGHGNLSSMPWSFFGDTLETVPELLPPADIAVYNAMRNDAQIAGLLLAQTLPIRRYHWYIDPNGAPDEWVDLVATAFNLPVQDAEQPKGRTRDRFSHDKHLANALLSLIYGFMFFEQVYRYENDDAATGRLLLRKLAPRMPLTISEIDVARDGGLKGIRQWPDQNHRGGIISSAQGPYIPVDKLVAYIHEQEASNWRGRSVLRKCYKDWIIKDRVIRVNAINIERNGAGVPIATAGENATQQEMQMLAALAQSYRAGDSAGGALPYGASLTFQGVQGSLPDAINTLRYHDQQMSKSFMSQYMDLGSTETGSRALGETFTDLFLLAQEALANEYIDITNEHVVEDLIDLNFANADGPVPLLAYDRDDDDSSSVVDLVALTQAGLITPGDEIEGFLRDRYQLPEMPEVDPDDPDPLAAPKLVDLKAKERPRRRERIEVRAAEAPTPAVGHRDPSDVELAAGTDFEAMEKTFTTTVDSLLADWLTQVKFAQVEDLRAVIASIDPNDLAALAAIRTSASGAVQLTDAMVAVAEAALDQAIAEAAAQGVIIERPDITPLVTSLVSRANALDTVMSQSISTTASQQALARAGGGLAAAEIAAEVADYLNELSDAYPREQLGGALTQAQNSARFYAFQQDEPDAVFASELLDSATCSACAARDGKEYDSLTAAEKDYPSGGYKECKGRGRCRGTIVCRYDRKSSQ
ncbi:hypothetical protein GTQ99_00335 [Kineococcus sp. T13]|uniref:phage portal protein family protein n=1 Tax=Kineococcus vitellinus TaxID=2696565 RepID=UPI0014126766|nr:hypothetical protein [Kineococcus vitellinus]NAZ73878.1 hypothetical protein [Kineococcus vitellinus]